MATVAEVYLEGKKDPAGRFAFEVPPQKDDELVLQNGRRFRVLRCVHKLISAPPGEPDMQYLVQVKEA